MEIPAAGVQSVCRRGAQPVQPPPNQSMFSSGAWCPPHPPQFMAPSSTPYWVLGLQQAGMAGSAATQGTWWAAPSIGGSSINLMFSGNSRHLVGNLFATIVV
ncbi:hypothetical protein PR202_gb23275 [Eleusine coracana subsp. coracana]|uniref:Uncharacterized protein n=1 Tax=Eleusine coracana subsp. coracana TaxID=191504 RepID=A0AAV5FII8_ELECO|nr:hypothetical protein PR202_gb23275 [Eleusine coracana subsp. coracana]